MPKGEQPWMSFRLFIQNSQTAVYMPQAIACRWLKNFVATGNIYDKLPEMSKEFLQTRENTLGELRLELLQGDHSEGEARMYRNLKHAQAKNPRIKQLLSDLGVGVGRAWRLLRARFPSMGFFSAVYKKVRDARQAQAAAKQILGWIAFQFWDLNKNDVENHPLHWGLQGGQPEAAAAGEDPFRWTPKLLVHNISMDAGTFDLMASLKDLHTGISEKGALRHPIEAPAMNKNVSSHTHQSF